MKNDLKLEITEADVEKMRAALEEMNEFFPDEEDTSPIIEKKSA